MILRYQQKIQILSILTNLFKKERFYSYMWTRVFGEIDGSQIRNLFIADQMLEVINVHFKHKRNKLNNKIGIFNIDYSTKIEFKYIPK